MSTDPIDPIRARLDALWQAPHAILDDPELIGLLADALTAVLDLCDNNERGARSVVGIAVVRSIIALELGLADE